MDLLWVHMGHSEKRGLKTNLDVAEPVICWLGTIYSTFIFISIIF